MEITEKCFYFSLGMHTVPNFYFGPKNSSLLEDVFFKIKNYLLSQCALSCLPLQLKRQGCKWQFHQEQKTTIFWINTYNSEHDVIFLARVSKSIIGISYQSKTEGMKYENPSKKEKGIHVLFLIEISGKLLPIIRCKRQTFGYGTQ